MIRVPTNSDWHAGQIKYIINSPIMAYNAKKK